MCPDLRSESQELAKLLSSFSHCHEGGHWLAAMLAVLDDEPLLVIEPATRRGFRFRMSGVGDNFQLHMLLMDELDNAIPADAAAVARGDGPQVSEAIVIGKWNLCTWQAVDADGRLNDADSDAWIWGEGTPADIPVFEDDRVVLLGVPSYERSWRAQRSFDLLRARLEHVETLSPEQVDERLQRMAAAKR